MQPASAVIVIPARLSSTRLPRKMLLAETGRTLIEHTWRAALGSRRAARVVVALGQAATNPLVAAWCRAEGVTPGAANPGADGYLIGEGRDRDRRLICVAGADARGVAYGQDTLAQMLHADGARLLWRPGRVRDAPAVPWRGRPQTQVRHYLRPGELDLYVTSRVNFIDLRGGIYAFEPGDKLDAAEIRAAVTEAHRRGLVVFATVNCGIPRTAHAAALATFRELLELGADGVWLSFDDKGPGEAPAEIGRAHV